MWVRRADPKLRERLLSFPASTTTLMSLAAWNGSNLTDFVAKLNGGALRDSADEQHVVASTTANGPQKGLWGHLAIVLQQGTGRMYFNGQEVGTGTISIKPSDMGAAVLGSIGKPLYTGEPYFSGAIDELRIACRAYSPGEIKILAQTDL
jgi:hypothetical protein